MRGRTSVAGARDVPGRGGCAVLLLSSCRPGPDSLFPHQPLCSLIGRFSRRGPWCLWPEPPQEVPTGLRTCTLCSSSSCWAAPGRAYQKAVGWTQGKGGLFQGSPLPSSSLRSKSLTSVRLSPGLFIARESALRAAGLDGSACGHRRHRRPRGLSTLTATSGASLRPPLLSVTAAADSVSSECGGRASALDRPLTV